MIRGILRGSMLRLKSAPACFLHKPLIDALSMDIGRAEYFKKRDKAYEVLRGFIFNKSKDCEDILYAAKLGLIFDYKDSKFWQRVNTYIDIHRRGFSYNTRVTFLELFKDFRGHDPRTIRKGIKILLNELKELKSENILDIAIAALHIAEDFKDERLSNIEELLIENSEKFKLSRLCEVLYECYLRNITMKRLLKHFKEELSIKIEDLPIGYYGSVLLIYGSLCPEEYPDVMRIIEKQAFLHMNDFSSKELVDLITAFAKYHSGTEALFLEFDKCIGLLVDQIYHLDIAPVLAAFADRGYCNPKLFNQYSQKIKAYVHAIPVDQLASLSEAYKRIGRLSKVQDYLVPYIIKGRKSLDGDSLLRVLYSYLDSGLRKEVYDKLIPTVFHFINESTFFHFSRIGYVYGLAGNKRIVGEVFKRLLAGTHKSTDKIGTLCLLKLAYQYRADEEVLKIVREMIKKHLKEYDEQDLIIIGQYVNQDEAIKDALEYIRS